MDIDYSLDAKNKCAIDRYTQTLLPVSLVGILDEDIVTVVHCAFQQFEKIGKEIFCKDASLVVRQMYVTGDMLNTLTKSDMFSKKNDADDDSLIGEIFKVSDIHTMKTLSGSRIQLRAEINCGFKFNYVLFGLIDMV